MILEGNLFSFDYLMKKKRNFFFVGGAGAYSFFEIPILFGYT